MNPNYYYPTAREHLVALAKVIAIIIVIAIIAFTFASCTSKSGQLAQIKPEKVVILDSYPSISMEKTNDGKMYKYKVKRIDEGVVDVIYDMNQFETGDTIYHRFR